MTPSHRTLAASLRPRVTGISFWGERRRVQPLRTREPEGPGKLSRICDRQMTAASLSLRLMALAVSAVLLSSCGARSVDSETRLIEVHGDRVYICLSDAINASEPPSCVADIGTRDNPELHGRMVPELISVLGGTSESTNVSANEQDG